MIQHNEATVKIHFTRDYSLFTYKKGNRDLNLSKINNIKRDILNGTDMLKYCPIVVKDLGGKMEIIDGQHRYEVAKQLATNVFYVLMRDELDLVDIARINSRVEKWKGSDFLKCYIEKGIADYNQLGEFIYKYKFPIGVALALLTYGKLTNEGSAAGALKEKFEDGTFKCIELKAATVIADIVFQFSVFPAYKSRAFVHAICRILDAGKISIDDLIAKFQKNTDKLTFQANWKDYITNLEQIYNVNARERKVIY